MSDFEIHATKLLDVFTIVPKDIFRDFRGEYIQTFNEAQFHELLIEKSLPPIHFVQDCISVSRKNTLRGIHGALDDQNWKLTQCLHGEVYSVAVNNNKHHPQYLQWQGFLLSERNRCQLLIAPGMGNSLLALTDCTYAYKQSEYYRGMSSQYTLSPFDPRLKIYWPIKQDQVILSERDARA